MNNKWNKSVALFAGSVFLMAGASFADETGRLDRAKAKMKTMTSEKNLSETTNSAPTNAADASVGSTNAEMGGVRPADNTGSTDEANTASKTGTTASHSDATADHNTATTEKTTKTVKKSNSKKMKAAPAGHSSRKRDIPHFSLMFEPGSAMISQSNMDSLRKFINDEKAKAGEIDEITVAAWSDKALPQAPAELTEADRDLAMKRADAIALVLKNEFNLTDVETYNMAERANWLARTFDTKDAELKSIFSRKGAETPLDNEEFMVFKNQGGASEAVLVLEKDFD